MPVNISGTNGITNATWTTAGRPSAPSTGQQGYNTTTNLIDYYNGTSWQSVAPTSIVPIAASYLVVAGGGAGGQGGGGAGGFRTITQTSPAPDFKIKLGTTGSDLGKVLQCETGTSPMIILIPLSTSTGSGSTEFPVGAQVLLSRNGVGSLQIQPESGSGVTIRSADGMTYLRSTYSMATLMKLDNTTWYLVGDISPY